MEQGKSMALLNGEGTFKQGTWETILFLSMILFAKHRKRRNLQVAVKKVSAEIEIIWWGSAFWFPCLFCTCLWQRELVYLPQTLLSLVLRYTQFQSNHKDDCCPVPVSHLSGPLANSYINQYTMFWDTPYIHPSLFLRSWSHSYQSSSMKFRHTIFLLSRQLMCVCFSKKKLQLFARCPVFTYT